MFRLSDDEELDDKTLSKFIERHAAESAFRYKPLQDAYMTNYGILHDASKPPWKPDNRIAVNFAKYIVDTMNGFFIGIPIKIDCEDERVAKYVEFLDRYNDQDDNNAELSKICSIFGKGYEMYYTDQESKIGITYLSPMDAFMIYDDSVLERPRYFVRLYTDTDDVLHGSVSDECGVRYFVLKGKFIWEEEEKVHQFDGVPATEYRENAERMGIFEPVLTMIDAYNKALSEKANDVDYFADAYLKILGTLLDKEDVKNIRDDRIINFDGDTEKLMVEFLQKPNGDETQENLINRLEKLIFQISMVANISDENFGTSSGIALKYKLQAMSNLAKTKERKFTSGMNRRYRLIFSHTATKTDAGGAGIEKDDWVKLNYKFTPNFPANILEESQIAKNLAGVSSKETQLKVLSVVENVKKEMERIEKEDEGPQDPVMQQMFGGVANGQPGVLAEPGGGAAQV